MTNPVEAAKLSAPFIDRTNLPDQHPEYGKDHLHQMVLNIPDLVQEGRIEKAHRWLGWLQCAIVMGGGATLAEMKAINKST